MSNSQLVANVPSFLQVTNFGNKKYMVEVIFVPTVPHCSLATLIGLCVRVKLQRCLPFPHKVKITVAEGTHEAADEGECNMVVCSYWLSHCICAVLLATLVIQVFSHYVAQVFISSVFYIKVFVC